MQFHHPVDVVCVDRVKTRSWLKAEELDEARVTSVGAQRFETRFHSEVDECRVRIDRRPLERRKCAIEIAQSDECEREVIRRQVTLVRKTIAAC